MLTASNYRFLILPMHGLELPFCFLELHLLHCFVCYFPKNGEKKEEKPYLLLLGAMCLGLMIYYINRPVEGSLFIVLFLMLILQTVILQKSQNIYLEWKDTREHLFDKPQRFLFLSLRVITTFILFIMAFDSLYSMSSA